MLSLDECRKIIQIHINEGNLSTDRQLALTGWIAEGEFCFAFGINSTKFVETADMDYCLVGAGPTLVDRRDGEVIEMANNGSMENYEKRRDPYNGLSSFLRLSGTQGDQMRRDTIMYLRDVTEQSLAECRDIVDRLFAGDVFDFDTKMSRESDVLALIESFTQLGLNVKCLTTFEVAVENSNCDPTTMEEP